MQTHVYPAAPAGVQQPEGGVAAPAHHSFAEGGEHVESPGKSKGPLSKVKNKAKKLKDKLKKVTGSKSHGHGHSDTRDHGDLNIKHEVDHGDRAYQPHPNEHKHDNVDGGIDSYEDDDEEEHIQLLGDDQSKYEQVQSLGAMDKPAGGSEAEVHGGFPASTLAATPGTYNNIPLTTPYQSAGPQHDAPISPYKNAGPPNTLQAAPTVYHYPPASNDQVLGGLRDAPHEQVKPRQLQDMPYTSYNYVPSTDTSLEQLKPTPSEDVPYASYDSPPKPSLSHNLPYTSYAQASEGTSLEAGSLGLPTSTGLRRPDGSSHSSTRDAVPQRGPATSESPTASGVNVAYPDDIVKPNPEFGRSSSPMHNKIAVINEDVPPETRLDVGLAPNEYGSQESLLDKSVPENAPMSFEAADKSVDRPGSDTVAGSFLASPADVLSTSTYSMTGGQKFDVNKQEDERGIHFREASSLGQDDSESMPLDTAIGGELSGRGKNDKSALPESAFKRDESVDRKPVSDAFARPFFTSLADEMPKTMDGATRGWSFDSNEPEDLRDSRAVSSFGKDENYKEPTATRDENSGLKKDDDIDGYMNESNADVSGQPTLSQNGFDGGVGQSLDSKSMEPASSDQKSWGAWSVNKLNNAKDAVTTTLIGSEKTTADEQPIADTDDDARRQSPLSQNGLDARVGQSSYNDNVEPASGDQKSWGAWSAIKLINAKDAASATLMGSDKRAANEQPIVDTKDVTDEDARRQSPFSQNELEGGVGLPLHNSSVEPASNNQKSWGAWSVDKLNNTKNAVTTTLLASDRGAAEEQPIVDTESVTDDDASRQSPLSQRRLDGGVGQSSYNENWEPESSDQKSWGAWSADKLYNVKDAVATTLMSSDRTDAAEQPIVETENVPEDASRQSPLSRNEVNGGVEPANNDQSPLSRNEVDRGVEPSDNEQKSWGAWSADKLINSKDAVTTTLMGSNERGVNVQPTVDTEDVLGVDDSRCSPSDQNEVDTGVGQSSYNKNAEPTNSDQKSWGAWSADKLNNAKNTVTTTLLSSDKREADEQPIANTTFGKGESAEPLSTSFGKGETVESLDNDNVEPENNDQKSWGAWSADKLINAKDAVTTTMMGSNERGVNVQPTVDTEDVLGNDDSRRLPSDQNEIDTGVGQSFYNKNAEPTNSDQKSWGAWSADKLNNAKHTVTTTLLSSDKRAEDKQPLADTTFGKGESEGPLSTSFGKGETVESLDNDNVEPENNDQKSWGAWSADKLINAKDAVTTTMMGSDKRDVNVQPTVDTEDVLGDDVRRHSPFDQNEIDAGEGQSSYNKNAEPENTDQKSWGAWSADKLNNAKNTVTATLLGSDKRAADEQPIADTSFEKGESEEPLVTATGDEISGRRKGNEMETDKRVELLATSFGKGKSEEPLPVPFGDEMSGCREENEMEESISDEPLVMAIGDDASGRRREENQMESYLYESNDDARGQPPSDQDVVDEDASRQSPSGENALYDDVTVQSPSGDNLVPQSDEESWGKWSADKFNDEKGGSEIQVYGDDSIAADTQSKSLIDSADKDSNVINATAPTIGGIPSVKDNAEKRPDFGEDINTNLDDSRASDIQPESIYDSADKGSNIVNAAAPTIGTIPIVGGGDEVKRPYSKEIDSELDVNAPVGAIPIEGGDEENWAYPHDDINPSLDDSRAADTQPTSIYDGADDKVSNVVNAAALDTIPIVGGDEAKQPYDREEINTNLDVNAPVGAISFVGGDDEKRAYPPEDINTNLDDSRAADTQPKSMFDSADKHSNVVNAAAPTIDTIPIVDGDDEKRPYDHEDINNTDFDVNAIVGGDKEKRAYPREDSNAYLDDSRAADTQPKSIYDSADKSSNVANAAALTIGTFPVLSGDDEQRSFDREDINTNLDVNTTNKDVDYYDPNNASSSQFQEGFARGTGEAEEEALNSTVAGSAIGKLQGLTDVVVTKLGLTGNTNPDTLNVESGEIANAEPYRTEDVSIPQDESEKSERTGIVQGLKNTVTSSLGYGALSSTKPSHEQEVREQRATPSENEQVDVAQSQEQSGGALQGLKHAIASKLGYGASEEPRFNDQTTYDDSGEHANTLKAGHTSNEEAERNPAAAQQRKGGALQGLRNIVAAKLGYGGFLQRPAGDNATEATRDIGHDEVSPGSSAVEEEVGGGNQPVNYTQKLYESAAAAKDYILSPKPGNRDVDRDRNISLAPEDEKANL